MMARLSHSTFALLVSNVGSAGLSFVLSALIGRALGQDGLGVYATALAWVFPLSLVADFGLGTLITREVAATPESSSDYLRSAAAARLWLGGALMLLLVFAAPFLSSSPAVVMGLQISAPLIVILPSFGGFTAVFRARQDMWPIAWLNLGMLGAQVALTALIFLLGGDVIAALAVNSLTSSGQLFAAWWIYRRRLSTPPLAPLLIHREGDVKDSTQGRRGAEAQRRIFSSPFLVSWWFPVVKQAWPFAVAGILAAVQARVSVILLERLTDTASVGYYAAAARFVEAGRMMPGALFGALFPALSALTADPTQFRRVYGRVTLALCAYGVALGILFWLLSTTILRITYGQGFALAAPVLQVAMWTLLPGLLRAAQTLYWYAQGREQFTNRVTGLSLIGQIVLSLWLIPAHGALGAAAANLLVETGALVLLWLPAARRFRRA